MTISKSRTSQWLYPSSHFTIPTKDDPIAALAKLERRLSKENPSFKVAHFTRMVDSFRFLARIRGQGSIGLWVDGRIQRMEAGSELAVDIELDGNGRSLRAVMVMGLAFIGIISLFLALFVSVREFWYLPPLIFVFELFNRAIFFMGIVAVKETIRNAIAL